MKYRFIILLVFVLGIALFSSSNMMVDAASTTSQVGEFIFNIFGIHAATSSQHVVINSVCSGVACTLPNAPVVA